MRKYIHGTNIINAKLSALNNDKDRIGGNNNEVPVKTFRKEGDKYGFLSGQSLRYWIRTDLKETKNWVMSPITRGKKVAFTEADPVKYPDDDMFGYMRAEKEKDEESGKSSDVTRTRFSPFKNSPAETIRKITLSKPFGSMSRHDGDPVPFTEECYSGLMLWSYHIDVNSAGRFTNINIPGKRNISNDLIKRYIENKTENGELHLDREARCKRIIDILSVIPKMYGGAKQARFLTDVSPQIVILSMTDNGNPIFSNIERGAKSTINTDQLQQKIDDEGTGFISKVYIGWTKGFLTDEDEIEISKITKTKRGEELLVVCKNVNDAYKQFIGEIQEKL